jgi:hypothetical protein
MDTIRNVSNNFSEKKNFEVQQILPVSILTPLCSHSNSKQPPREVFVFYDFRETLGDEPFHFSGSLVQVFTMNTFSRGMNEPFILV